MSTIRVVNIQHTDATEPNIVLEADGTTVFASGITISGGTNLTVSGTAEFASGTVSAPSITFIDDNNTGLYSPAADTVAITTAATERLRINSTGNVGIGTTSPSRPLHINGGSNVNNILVESTNNASYITFADTNTTSNTQVRVGSSGNALRILTGGSDSMRIDSSGNVGIGTTSPTNVKLDVKESATDTVGTGHIGFSGGSTPLWVWRLSSADSDLNLDRNYGGWSSTPALTFKRNTGNVGIGTTSPATELHVASNGTTGIRIDNTSAGGNAQLELVGGNQTNPWFIYTDASRNLIFQDFSAERARIDSSGRLLVGTSSAVASGTERIQALGSLSLYDPTSGTAGAGQTINFRTDGGATGAIKASISGQNEGSFSYAGRLVFSTTADGASTPTERMRINRYGTHTLKSQDVPTAYCYRQGTNGGNSIQVWQSNYGSTGSTRAYVRIDGGLANYQANNSNLCDEREKKNIESLDSTWYCLKHWNLTKFHYNEDSDTDNKHYGVIAQQIAEHCPEVIADWIKQEAKDAVLDKDGNVVTPAVEEVTRMGVKEQQMMWMAIKALQEAQLRIETLEQRLTDAGIA